MPGIRPWKSAETQIPGWVPRKTLPTFLQIPNPYVLLSYAESRYKKVEALTIKEKHTALEKAGRKTVHSLRHTFALRKLLELGNIYLVMQMMGHADVTTTQIYLKFPEGYLKEVFSKWIPDVERKVREKAVLGAKA